MEVELRARFRLLEKVIGELLLRSMAYHVIHGSDVTSNIIPYAE